MNLEKMNKEFKDCSCKKQHVCPIDNIEIGSNAILKISKLCKDYEKILIVADKNTYKTCKNQVNSLLNGKIYKVVILKSKEKVVVPNEQAIKEIEDNLIKETSLIIGIGSGVINDLCKYVSFNHNLPYYIIATAPSMDGYASVGSALILDGMKVTINCRPPKAIIGDTKILRKAPLKMLKSGYGDIIGKYSCLNDWKLSHVINNEYFCQKIYDYTLKTVEKISGLASKILKRDEKTIEYLMDALVTVGVLMSYVNSSRPASGSEHHLSHFFEITGLLDNKKYFMHGIDVAYSSLYTQKLREELTLIKQPTTYANLSKTDYQEEIKRIYKGISQEIFTLQEKTGFYKVNRFEVYKEKWAEIIEILNSSLSSSSIETLLKKIKLNVKNFKKLYGEEKIRDAIWFAKDLKDRYSILWLYFDINYGRKL